MYGTLEEQNPQREDEMVWAKDVVAGLGVVIFMVWAFALAGFAQVALS
jgi:hypothetical protein